MCVVCIPPAGQKVDLLVVRWLHPDITAARGQDFGLSTNLHQMWIPFQSVCVFTLEADPQDLAGLATPALQSAASVKSRTETLCNCPAGGAPLVRLPPFRVCVEGQGAPPAEPQRPHWASSCDAGGGPSGPQIILGPLCGGRRVRERPSQDKQQCACCFFVMSLCVSPPPPSLRHVRCSSSLLFPPPSDAASSQASRTPTHHNRLCVASVCLLPELLDRVCVCVCACLNVTCCHLESSRCSLQRRNN